MRKELKKEIEQNSRRYMSQTFRRMAEIMRPPPKPDRKADNNADGGLEKPLELSESARDSLLPAPQATPRTRTP